MVLFLALGSLFGMLLPIVTALFGIGISSSAIILLSHGMDVADFAPQLATLVGLGVGIDYALFIVTRHRKGILRGRTPEEAAVTALNTSGRAVLFAGGTVCIALLGMFTLRLTFLNGVAVAAALTVVITVAAAVTLLPALLGVLGMRVLSRRQRRKLAADGPQTEPVRRARRPAGRPSWSGTRAPSRWPRSRSWRRWRSPRCRCAWAPPTRATTRRRPPPARRTTCSPTASGRASTVR